MPVERFEPRQQILEIWRAASSYSVGSDHEWRFDAAPGADSITDAEHLLCLLYPATALTSLRIENPADIKADVAEALQLFGDRAQIPRVLVVALDRFLTTHTGPDGAATFSAPAHLFPLDQALQPSAEQARLDLTASFTATIRLALAGLSFLDAHAIAVNDDAWRTHVLHVRSRLSARLTDALVGLLRGFTIVCFAPTSTEGVRLARQLNQAGQPEEEFVASLRVRTNEVRAMLTESRRGARSATELDDPDSLFEVGWTWGVANDAPMLDKPDDPGIPPIAQRAGIASAAPTLRPTMLAVDAVVHLVSDRTRVLSMFNAYQERLVTALELRNSLTQIYWSRVARFGRRRWPVEDLPWLASDGVESLYYTLVICALLTQDALRRTWDVEFMSRTATVLSELAREARITRRPLREDAALQLHTPGIGTVIAGVENLGPALSMHSRDFAALVLKCGEQLLGMTSYWNRPAAAGISEALLKLGDVVWDHLSRRRLADGPARGLWDDPSRVYPQLSGQPALARWDQTFAVVDALTHAATWHNAQRRHREKQHDQRQFSDAPEPPAQVADQGQDTVPPPPLLNARSLDAPQAGALGTRRRRLSV